MRCAYYCMDIIRGPKLFCLFFRAPTWLPCKLVMCVLAARSKTNDRGKGRKCELALLRGRGLVSHVPGCLKPVICHDTSSPIARRNASTRIYLQYRSMSGLTLAIAAPFFAFWKKTLTLFLLLSRLSYDCHFEENPLSLSYPRSPFAFFFLFFFSYLSPTNHRLPLWRFPLFSRSISLSVSLSCQVRRACYDHY